ncbi:MAG TPA: cation-translocating P-type ATPase, partial [Thermomicrobiales bacterium]|nr:cation-translocating P-type ATPase [Thermomicrobiales bacterium]
LGGHQIMRAGLASLRARRVDMNVLMTVSVFGAAILGEWSEGALVVVLFSIGTTLQAVAFDRTRGAIRALLDLTPQEARVVRHGIETTVAVASLERGDIVRVRPGERLPADGEVLTGFSAVDQAPITGESMPVERGEGDEVFAGSLNGSGVLDIRVTKRSSQSMLANIVHLVEGAQSSRAPSQQLVDRFASVYTPIVVALAAAIALAGGGIAGDWGTWVYRSLVLLVIACPCALVISTPVSIVSAIGAATRHGMLVKGGAALEEAGRSRLVAFDKTGTLTLGRPTVTRIVVPEIGSGTYRQSEQDLLALAAAVERDSEHPLAGAVVAKALHDRVPELPATNFEAFPGRGASSLVDGREIAVGNKRLMIELGVPAGDLVALDVIAEGSLARAGETALLVAERMPDAWHVLGVIAVADRVRPGAKEAVQRLRDLGIERVVMLTGDRRTVAETIGAQVGVDEIRAELLPHEKAEAIASLQADGWHVTQVGDGVNDAPALATADVGIAMGMGGTDLALESADLALMRDDLWVVGSVIALSRRTVAIIRQNITLSMVTKLIALLLGVLGFVNLWIAVLADVGTSVLVTLNGLRLAHMSDVPAPTASPAEAAVCSCADCGSAERDTAREELSLPAD